MSYLLFEEQIGSKEMARSHYIRCEIGVDGDLMGEHTMASESIRGKDWVRRSNISKKE